MRGICLFFSLLLCFCSFPELAKGQQKLSYSENILVGAEQLQEYLPFIANKTVAIVANQSSYIGNTHLVDTLKKLNVKIKAVFAPEHGFRGNADAGEKVQSGQDEKTKIPVFSLYGSHKKPTRYELQDVNVVIFDIQDVGVRFYTYISTLHYVMEACAEYGSSLIVLDRPNPNGFYVDGPVLEKGFESFVGMHPVPIVYGLTIGEYARMINGERWLKDSLKCNLKVVKLKNYTHKSLYKLPIAPSPNLRTMEAIYLYPSLCLFEGTPVSVGRGTENPFTVAGRPGFDKGDYAFTPVSSYGAKDPMYKNNVCRGFDLLKYSDSILDKPGLRLSWIESFYKAKPDTSFFTPFFSKLAGTSLLEEQLRGGLTEEEIKVSWQPALNEYKAIRKKYLLYEDF